MSGRINKDVLEDRLRALQGEKTSLLIEIAELKEAIETSELRAKVQGLEEEVETLKEQKKRLEENIGPLPSERKRVMEAPIAPKQTMSLGKSSFEEVVEKPVSRQPLRFQFQSSE